jgi:rhodanese-related sulfurtransferase
VVKEIDSRELENRLSADDKLYLLDIRSEAEVMHGMLPNSEHLPMHLIPLRVMDFPKDREIILYCRSGARSYHACRFLMQQGFDNVINLKGGIIDWARNGFEIVPMAEA